jgi:hypothetical protein
MDHFIYKVGQTYELKNPYFSYLCNITGKFINFFNYHFFSTKKNPS